MQRITEEQVRDLLGDPKELASDLYDFQRAASALSSKHPRLIDEYPKQWVGVYQGEVQAAAASFDDLMSELDRRGIPAEHTIGRFIDKNQRTMIR